MKIRTNDQVVVIKGKNRGQSGKVTSVDPTRAMVKVSGVNIAKKHIRPGRGAGAKQTGGIVEVAMPLHASKVMFRCGQCNKPTRLGYKISKSGSKERICRACQATV